MNFILGIKKIYKLVDHNLYLSNYFLVFFFILQAILETLSIGMVIPFINIILNENFQDDYPLFFNLLSNFGINTPKLFLIASIITIFLIYLVKNLLSVFITFYQASFSHNVTIKLAKKMFTHYLYAPYSFHVNKNKARLVRNIFAEVNQFNAGLLSFLVIVSDVIIILFIFIFIMIFEIKTAIMVSMIFGLSSIIYYYFTRKVIDTIGKQRLKAEANIYKVVSQSLYGIRDLILLQCYNYFKNSHSKEMGISANSSRILTLFASLPRIWIETVAICAITIVVVIFAIQEYSFNQILAMIGLYAAAGFRLLPAVNRLLGNLQKLKFVMPVIYNLHKELEEITNLKEKKVTSNLINQISFENNIVIKNISFHHIIKDNQKGSISKEVLSKINFEIKKGQMIGIMGKSGSGKSTLIDLISGLIKPTSGEILYDNYKNVKDNMEGWQNKIAYVSQNSFLVDDTIKNNIAFGVNESEIDMKKIYDVIKDTDLDTYVSSLSNGVESLVGENGIKLSGGQRQRICIARYLYFDREILIFDESTSSLDIETEKKIVNTIKKIKGDKTIIIVSHRLSALSFCDKFIKLENHKATIFNDFDNVIEDIRIVN